MGINVGVIGLGYWGPNFVRNLIQNELVEDVWGCDLSENALAKIKHLFPQVKTSNNYKELLSNPSIQCVVVTTPPHSHYPIIKAALESGKHVISAKPMATSYQEAAELLTIAKSQKLLLHGDLTYLYTGAVKKIKELVENNEIGEPFYFDSTRSNLGLIQKDVNVIWDLAPHDLAIINYCFGLKPVKLFAVSSRHYENSLNDEMAHITINYERGFTAHIHVSWISPVKIRTIFIGGSKKMISFDDVEPDEKIKLYDKGVEIDPETITAMTPVYRSGDVFIPRLSNEEAIQAELKDIFNAINDKTFDYKNAEMNIMIVKILELCDQSIREEKVVEIKN